MTVTSAISGRVAALTKVDIERTIAERFESQVTLHPVRTAISDGARALTYAELNSLANRMAHVIATRIGAAPSRVVVYMEKGSDCIAAILAVLKAGHAYVPVDPQFPRSRNETIVSDSEASLLVTNSDGLADAKLLATGRVPVVNVDDVAAEAPDGNLEIAVSPDALAYIIYTSGSTGKPKGVMQSHRNVLHGCWRRSVLQRVSPEDRMTLFYSCSVMGSVYCIFGALLNGASLHPYDLSKDGLDRLAGWLRDQRITIYHSVASVFRQLSSIDSMSAARFDVRLVIFGGEAVRVSDVEQARRIFSRDCVFYTGLGSTETGTTRYFPIGPDTSLDGTVVPLGFPVEDMDIVLLDEHGAPVTCGQVGEIAVQSAYLALGYWNDDLATSRAFRAIGEGEARRQYRTGDLGCLHESGLLEHRGRKDFQVKIRGFRVETGEIEAALLAHPGVNQAVVIARNDAVGDKQLVAYTVPEESSKLAAALRSLLRESLPEYMVPSRYVSLGSLPLTPNGKVDRNQLPAPEESAAPIEEGSVAGSEIEERLIMIFEEVLKSRVTSRDDSFFDLGGHSLSALGVVTSINRRFDVDLPPIVLFSYPRIKDLAAVLADWMEGRFALPKLASPALDAQGTARVDFILSAVKSMLKERSARASDPCPKMQESWLCKHILSRLYAYHRRSVRLVLTRLILKLEGGKTFSVTMRNLFAKYHQIEIGDFTAVIFDDRPLRPKTKIGRYCSIYPTAVFQNADHPRNTMATHALFYARGYGFTPGYELDRKQIEIGNDVWIGNGAKILYPTEKVGDGAVIAAGAIVIEDVPPYAIVGGHPAQVIRYRFSEETIAKMLEIRWWDFSLEELQSVRDEFMKPLEGDRIR